MSARDEGGNGSGESECAGCRPSSAARASSSSARDGAQVGAHVGALAVGARDGALLCTGAQARQRQAAQRIAITHHF